LVYAPGDVDVLERYGRLLHEQAHTLADKERVLAVYEQVLSREPARHDLRRATVDLALEMGDFDRAKDHLESLVSHNPDDGELADLVGQCQEALGQTEEAAASYREAVAHAPERIDAYSRLARLLRGPLNQPADADQVMDDLVAANDHAVTAYLERAAYCIANGSLEDADKDAAHARELAPDDARVIRTTTDLDARLGRDDAARAGLRRGIQLHPDDVDLRIALANLELKAGKPNEAAECLEAGRKAAADKNNGPNGAELLNLLAETRLQQGRTRDVEDLIAEARKDNSMSRAAYLTARLQMHGNQWGEAARTLEESTKAASMSLDQAVRTLLCLGQCYEHLGAGDRRLDALRQAVAFAPASAPVGAEMGAALLDAGRVDEAIEQLRRTTTLPQPPAEAWASLARALLQRNQTLPTDKRDWREVDNALGRAGQTPATAQLRAAASEARNQPDQATALLEQMRTQHPDQPGAWTALALNAARRGDATKAAAILVDARNKLGDKVEFRLAALQLSAGVEGAKGDKDLGDLAKNLDAFTPQERTLLLSRLAETNYRRGKAAEGDRLCRLIAAEPAEDLSARLPLLEAVLLSGDDGLVDGVLADVRRLEGDDGVWWKYGRAAQLVTDACRGDRAGLGEAKTLLAYVAGRRPDWSRVALLQGRVGALDDDANAALDGYQRAFDLGERRLDVAQALVPMLMERGRWEDADQVMRKLQEQLVFHGTLARQAADIAMQTHDSERAVELARLGAPVEDAYPYHVWLGRLLTAAGRDAEGESELRRAAAFPDAGWDATAALAAHLTQHGRKADAEGAIEQLRVKLPPRYAALQLAQCFEAAGRLDRAEQSYNEALTKRPDDGAALLRVAAFDLRLNRQVAAESVLRRLLNSGRDVSAADRNWGRRELAMVLAASGANAKYEEALTLLAPALNASAADRRARAFVAGARPEGRAEALRRLEEEVKAGRLPADEQFRLVQLCDAAGDWPQARDRLVGLLTQDQQNPEYLAYLIDGLLRQDQAAEAGPWIARLETLEPATERAKSFRSRLAKAAALAEPAVEP
jgi:tetratricopeptide (TPR) repeat protein